MQGFIKDEIDRQLELHIPKPPPDFLPPGADPPPSVPELPEDVVDTPLIRLYNFLRMMPPLADVSVLTPTTEMMSMSYQLEALWFQVIWLKSKRYSSTNTRFLGYQNALSRLG